MIVYQIFLNLKIDDWSAGILLLTKLPMYYRWEIFTLAIINFVLTYFNEKVLITCLNTCMQNRAERKRLATIE
jgi:hypothetical protein